MNIPLISTTDAAKKACPLFSIGRMFEKNCLGTKCMFWVQKELAEADAILTAEQKVLLDTPVDEVSAELMPARICLKLTLKHEMGYCAYVAQGVIHGR